MNFRGQKYPTPWEGQDIGVCLYKYITLFREPYLQIQFQANLSFLVAV